MSGKSNITKPNKVLGMCHRFLEGGGSIPKAIKVV